MDENGNRTEDKTHNNPGDCDIDTFLQYGRYQALRVWGLGSILAFTGALSYAHLVFVLADPPGWSCQDPGRAQCRENVTGRESICEGGEVIFDTTHPSYFSSLLVDKLWICNDKYLGPSVMTANYLGGILNSLVFGFISDKYGRKFTFSIANILYIIIRLATYQFYHSYTAFVGLIILGNSFFPFAVRVGYTLLTEICDERGRKYNYIVGRVVWVAALVLLPFIARLLGDWYRLGVFSVSLHLVFLLLHPAIPESPRWLVSQGRLGQAAALINTIRRCNNLAVIEKLENKLEEIESAERNPTLNSFIFNIPLIRVFVSMALIWTVNDYFYIAGSLNVENLAGNMFLNFSLLSLTELPSVFIGQFLMDRYGRRWVHCVCMVVATLPLLLCVPLVAGSSPHTDTAVIALAVTSKVASNVGWFIMWVQCIEIFPTSLRSTGITITSTVATLVSMTGPFVVDLGKLDLSYPFIVFTCLGVVGIIFTSLVPETKGNAISENIEDTIQLIKRFQFFQWRTWSSKQETKSS